MKKSSGKAVNAAIIDAALLRFANFDLRPSGIATIPFHTPSLSFPSLLVSQTTDVLSPMSLLISPSLPSSNTESLFSSLRRTAAALFLLTSTLLLGITEIQAQTPSRIYDFNNSYADTNGGSAMVPNGGTLGATGYTFAAGQGPNVSNALSNTGEYTIEMLFRFDTVSGYRSILSFNGLTLDEAIYCSNGSVIFYNYSPGNSTTADLAAGQTHRVVITRNGTTKVTTAYVDGVQKSQVTDTNDRYVASASGGILHFFRDNGGENSSGFVDQIRLYNAVLTPAQVAALAASPAPTVSAIAPVDGPTTGGTRVTITGAGFSSITGVTIGGAAATDINVINTTSLTCTTPAGSAGSRSVVVTNAAGSNTANSLFTYVVSSPGTAQSLNASIVGSYVLATAVQLDGKIIIAGRFSQVAGVARNNIARLNADGSLDSNFNPNANGDISGVILQPDGRIVIAGSFTTLQPNGAGSATTRNRLARLNGDGSLDTGFDTNVNNTINTIALQPDGKILLGGIFTVIRGSITRNRIARVNSDGTHDSTFSPGVNADVFSIIPEPDGRILIGGAFTTFQSTGAATAVTWNYLARVSSTGVLDNSFAPTPNNKVWSLLAQPNGQIIVGGEFSSLQPNGAASPTARLSLARINANGTLDAAYAPSPNGIVYGLAQQADGKVIIGGSSGLIRYNENSTSDGTLSASPNGGVYSVVLQQDGRVLVGGTFTSIGGAARNYFARINNQSAVNFLQAPNSTYVLWTRGGTSPQLNEVTLEQSTNGGSSWTSLGTPSLVANTGNWQITGLSLPASTLLRARGRATGGYFNASVSPHETIAGFVNAAPSDITLSSTSIAENNAANATIGTLTTSDANTGDVFTYALASGGADNASFTLSGNSLRLTPVADFETKNSCAIRLRSTDAGGLAFEKNFTITINNANEMPSFTKGADAVHPFGTNTLQTVNGWATNINDGDATVSQSLTFLVSVASGSSLFTTQPAISSAGVLTYLPNGTAGTATVQVSLRDDTTAGGSDLTTAVQTFTITIYPPPPTISSLSPNAGPVTGGNTVTITGANFISPATVTFRGVTASNVNVVSSTTITATAPAGTTGTASVIVTTAAGTNAANSLYTYVTAPTLTGVSPPAGTTAGGTAVTLTGTNFTTPATVTFNGTSASSVTLVNSTTITAVTPARTAGAASVLVSTPGGTNSANSLYTYIAPPVITGVSPNTGITYGGTTVTITGTGFANVSSVAFGGNLATIVSVTPTAITVTTPPRSAGAVSIVCTAPFVSGTATNAFTYNAPLPGTVEPLNANIVGSIVLSAVPQSDGKTIITGNFSQVLGAGRNHIVRLLADGQLDTSFHPNPNAPVTSVALQRDGKILIGGQFTSLQPNGAATPTTRNRLARLNPDGSLDASFDPNANATVNVILPQPDGKILIAGLFNALQPNGAASPTTRNRIARLHADGSLDTGFDPDANGEVKSLLWTDEGKIVLGGAFTSLQPNGAASAITRNRIALLEQDGTVVSAFDPNADGEVRALALQSDGSIIVAGTFTSLQPNGAASATTRNCIARLSSFGALQAFDPNANGPVNTLALQSDGSILLGGSFTSLQPNGAASPTTRNRVARLRSSGSLDSTFDPNADKEVFSLALQADGLVLLGGFFNTLQPNQTGPTISRDYFARIENNAMSRTLTVTDTSQVDWNLSGTSPFVSDVVFEISADGGATWSLPFGNPARVSTSANWRLTGTDIPATGLIRASGRVLGGYQSGSSGSISQTVSYTTSVAVPAVTSIAPNRGSTLGGTAVTITGTGFANATAVSMNGVALSNVIVVNPTTITALTPAGSAGSSSVRVATPGGVSANNSLFTYVTPPAIAGISPGLGSTLGGNSIVISGTGFSNVTGVTIGGNPAASYEVNSASQITAVTPPGTAGTAAIIISVNGADSAPSSLFSYVAPPTVTGVSPASGTTIGGNTVTISGTGFTLASGVAFGGVAAGGFTIASDTTITATTPAHTAGPKSIVITTPGGSNAATTFFSYVAPTTTTLASSQNPSAFLVLPTLTAEVTSPTPGLTGDVKLYRNNVLIDTQAINGSGIATFNLTVEQLPVASHEFRAVFNSDQSVANYASSEDTLTQVVQKAVLPIALSELTHVYNGSPQPVLATITVPFGYTVDVTLTYDGSPNAPTNVGSYDVVANIDHPQFTGSATGELVISKAEAYTNFFGLLQAFDGTPRPVDVQVIPDNVPLTISYQPIVNGTPQGASSTEAPSAVGKYLVTATTPNHNLTPSSSILTVTKKGVSISLGKLSVTVDGQPKPVTVRTVPENIPVTVTYSANGIASTTAPSAPPPGGGDWQVSATVTNQTSYTGSATAVLKMISRVAAPLTLTGPATCTPYNKPSYTAKVTPIRPGVRPSGTVFFKHNGQEIFRANPGADGVCVLPNHYIKVSPTPYVVFAEYSGDENYLPNTSAPVQTISQRHVIFSGYYNLFQIYDGQPVNIEPWMLYYLDNGRPYTSYTTTFNGSPILPTNVTTTPLKLETVIQIPADDVEVHEWTSLHILKGNATIKLGKLRQSFTDGANFPVEVITDPPGVPVTVSYNGSVVPQGPDYPGTFNVRAWISDPNYEPAEVTGQLVVTRAPVQFTVSNLVHEYDGSAKGVSVQARPAIPYSVTYNGSNQLPTAPGIYRVEVVPSDQNSFGSGNSYTMTINARVSATSRSGATTGIGSFTLSGIASGSTSTFPALVTPGNSTMSLRFNETISPTEKITFRSWADGSTQNPRTISIGYGGDPAQYNYVANVLREIYLKPTETGNGNALGGGYYQVGNLANFEAWSPSGTVVDRWTYDGITLSPVNNSGHRVLRGGREVFVKVKAGVAAPTAHFVPGYIGETLTGSGKGSATFVRKGRSDMEPVSQGGVPSGVNIIATAVPAAGFRFSHWSTYNSAFVDPSMNARFQNPVEVVRTGGEYSGVSPHFIKDGPELEVSINGTFRGVDPLLWNAPVVQTEITIRNRGGRSATNLRIEKIEATGYRFKFRNDPKEYFYYPTPSGTQETIDKEIAANNASANVINSSMRSRIEGLSPWPYFMLSPLNISVIPPNVKAVPSTYQVGTVSSEKTFKLPFYWPDGDITTFPYVPAIFADVSEVRLRIHVNSNEVVGSIDTWTDFQP